MWVRITVPTNKQEHIVRCIGLSNLEDKASEVSRLSYCPSRYLKEGVYNRCNLPKQEMFYGTLYGEECDEIKHALMTSIIEVSSLCHETSTYDEYYLMGEWIVKRELQAIVVFDHNKAAKNSIFKDAKNLIETYVAARQIDVFGNSLLIEAFSREVVNNNDYKVSAAYSSYLFDNFPIDAIVYPSVRTDSYGTCIAIRPTFVDSGGIELINAYKYKVFLSGVKKVDAIICQKGQIDKETGKVHYEDYV